MNNSLENRCMVCNGVSLSFFVEKNGHKLFRCNDCRFIFVSPIPKDLLDLYSQTYFTGAEKGFGYACYEEDKYRSYTTFNNYLDILEKYLPKKGKLLDVGAATGYFLDLARKKGWKAYGLEISHYAAERARSKGIHVEAGILEENPFGEVSFDAITFNDVIEHMPNPRIAVRAAWSLLRSGGIILITTPDSDSFYAKLFGKYWHALVPPEHLYYFNQDNLSQMLRKEKYAILLSTSIGTRFTCQYILTYIANRKQTSFWRLFARLAQNKKFGKLPVPVCFHGNFTLLAQKP